jgi:heme o synthase
MQVCGPIRVPVLRARTLIFPQNMNRLLIYSILPVPISLSPCADLPVGAAAVTCGAVLVAFAFQLHGSKGTDRRVARRLFAFSILYLFVLFAALLADNLGNHGASAFLARAGSSSISSLQGEMLDRAAR